MTPSDQELETLVVDLARRACHAAQRMSELSTSVKNAWLLRSAERLEAAKAEILAANARDVARAEEGGLSGPLLGRLAISDRKWNDMIAGLHDVAALLLITMVMAHIYFALRPEKLFFTRSMVLGWITRDEHAAHHDPARWRVDSE